MPACPAAAAAGSAPTLDRSAARRKSPVRPGNRESGLAQISGDVAAGERVVVRGAPLIRLASLSPRAPAHGHTH